MTTDKELLSLAAKAAGLHIKAYQVDTDDSFLCLVVGEKFTRQKDKWNPLDDDGDALRLAVTTGVLQGRGFDNAWTAMYAVGKLPKDKFEAYRRAITMAAAEIGRTMP